MADTSLFSRLQRLFSTDVVIRNQGGNQLKVIDADRIQTSGEYETNALVNRFKGIYQKRKVQRYENCWEPFSSI